MTVKDLIVKEEYDIARKYVVTTDTNEAVSMMENIVDKWVKADELLERLKEVNTHLSVNYISEELRRHARFQALSVVRNLIRELNEKDDGVDEK
jgi:hypothetical protein